MTPLRTWERRVFRAAATAALGVPDFGAEPLRAVNRMVRRLPAGRRRMLSAFLGLLEFGGAVLRRAPMRFSSLSREDAADLLAAWAVARQPARRRGVSGLRALAGLAYYGSESAWREIGYDGPWLGRVDVARAAVDWPPRPVPVSATAGTFRAPDVRVPPVDRVLAPGLTLGRSAIRDLAFRCDVIVVGAGAGGAAAFARLVEGGANVVLLDAGGAPGAERFNQRELDMMPLLYREAGLRGTSDEAIGILQGTGIGGSTLHNTGLVVPPPPGIRARWRRDHGLPWSDEELAERSTSVMTALGAVPIPEARINPFNAALRAGAASLGWSSFVARHNRTECSGCGYCMIGCAYDRKTNAAIAFVGPAVRAGGRVLADARADQLREERDGWSIRGELVGAGGGATGRRFEGHARGVIVACGALDTPVLLRRSGLGNRRVGEGLRLHPVPLLTGVFDEPLHAWRGLPQSVLVDEYATFNRDGRGGFLLLAWNAGPGMTAAVQPRLGAAHRRAMELYPRLGTAAVLLHDETSGRVRPGPDGGPRVAYRPRAGDRRELRRGMYAVGRLLLAAGAEEVLLPAPGAPAARDPHALHRAIGRLSLAPHRLRLDSVHPQGTCAMGSDPNAACDVRGRLRGAPGVYVADTSLFPTSVGVPPQVTTMTLGSLVAEGVLEDLG